MSGARMKARLHREMVPRSGRYDVYITCVATSPIADDAALDEFLQELAAACGAETRLLQCKIYGLRARRDTILRALRTVFQQRGLDTDFPTTFLEGAACRGGIVAGAQVIGTVVTGLAGCGVEVETVQHHGTAVGRRLRTPDHVAVFLAGLSGFDAGAGDRVEQQAEKMFRNAAALLQTEDLTPRHIVRTWIYLPHLLHWYGEFNRVRTACYREFGIIDDHGKGRLPASTGIQGTRSAGEECFMDLLAIKSTSGTAPVAIQMHNTRQNEASDYGSSFSRGMAVYTDTPPTLYVSGTASIDAAGRTVYRDDAQGQVMETLLHVAALLEGQEATLDNIRLATAYCKDVRTYRVFEQVVDLLGLTGIPFVPVLADVCRDELLFEVDCIAVAATQESPERAKLGSLATGGARA